MKFKYFSNFKTKHKIFYLTPKVISHNKQNIKCNYNELSIKDTVIC